MKGNITEVQSPGDDRSWGSENTVTPWALGWKGLQVSSRPSFLLLQMGHWAQCE